ncbi:MAG: hypothetical protein M5R36_14940 [Deltaproteobacteria bacterium]|nr:hypothetical protein [Deltaproteobacteria bacterium]
MFRISYDGPPDVHDALRGPNAYAVMEEAIDAVLANGNRVVLNATISSSNVHRVVELVEYAVKRNLPIKFQPVFDGLAYGKDVRGQVPDRDSFREAVRYLAEEKKKNPLVINSEPNMEYYTAHPAPPFVPCVSGVLYVRIDPQGMLFPCSIMLDDHLKRDAVAEGFAAAFQNMPRVHCTDCMCPQTLEMNYLFDMNLRSLKNLPKLF